MKRWALAGGLVAVVFAVGILALREDETAREPSRPPTAVRTKVQPLPSGQLIAYVRPGSRVGLRAAPGGRLVGSVDGRTEFGSRETLSPTGERRGDWLAVRHTSLGNGGVAWVDARAPAVALRKTATRIEVDLSERMLYVEPAGKRIEVAVGARETPTPVGDYYVTDKLRGADFGSYYGCCILALSGRQPNLPQGWSGGDRLAIHGSPTPTWGENVSNGCLHAREVDLRWLMKHVPIGTAVEIRA